MAIKNCGDIKAPSADGFNFGFRKKFWSTIKEDLVKAGDYFWETGIINKGCNASFVTLILKTSDVIGLGDLKPISLIGCYYKIISKILA